MPEEEFFDGIILPFVPFNFGGVGGTLGLAARELGFGGEGIKFNLALLDSKELEGLGLLWMGDFPSIPEYSKKASHYWLLKALSKYKETDNRAIRVRPKETRFSHSDYNIVCWSKGKPLPAEEQYHAGLDSMRYHPNFTLFDVIKSWSEKKYQMKYSDKIGKLSETFDKVFESDKSPHMQLLRARQQVEVQARNAAWPAESALVAGLV